YQDYEPFQMVSDKVRIGGVKFFMDNGPNFSNIDRNHWFTPEELDPLVKNAHDLGFQISIHSFIDNATDTALNALDAAQGDNSNRMYRHRIEHASFLRDDQLTRLDQMNVIISAQLLWHTVEWADWIINDTQADPTPDLHLIVARWRDVIDQGIHFIGSTDTPWIGNFEVGPAIEGIYRVTTRKNESDLGPPAWMLDQRITIEEALKSITIDAAYGAFEEDVKGSIKVGKFADFVVLSSNPLETPLEDLRDITVDMTIIDGEVAYCADGLESLCEGTSETSTSSKSSISSQITSSVPETLSSSSDESDEASLRVSPFLIFNTLIIFVYIKSKFSNVRDFN
ncbi:MAG: amidohydrolase family protein, partial [Candidatus Kariarchaeaceae archaeon]